MTRPLSRRRRTIPTFTERRWLLSGRPYAIPFLEGGEWAARLWREFGAMITERHIRKHPGSRPWGWWKYDAPQPRNSSAETQLAYLQRLNLLTEEEKERVPHVRPRLRPSTAPAQPLSVAQTTPLSDNQTGPASAHSLSPLATTPLSSDRTVEKGYQFVLIDDRVQLVRK